MKNLGIILSTWVLLFFAVACMKQEKDVFKSAEAEGRKNGTPIVLQEGGKDEIMGGSTGGTTSSSACLPPTQLVVSATSGQSAIFSWTHPSPGSSYSYFIQYYWNGVLIFTTTVNGNQITLPVPQQGTYSIEIYTMCSNNVSVPLAIYNSQRPLGPGGNGVVICDNLDNCIPSTTLDGSFTRPNTNTTVQYKYIHSSFFAYTNITSTKIKVNLTNSTLLVPVSTAAANYYCTFTVPNNLGGNSSCPGLSGTPNFDVTLELPAPTTTTTFIYIAYKRSTSLGGWNYVIGQSGQNVILPNLIKNQAYQVRLLSQYTPAPTVDANNPCLVYQTI